MRMRVTAIDNSETAFRDLRVKMAQTVVRRLEERAVPIFLDEAPKIAQARGVRNSERLTTYKSGAPYTFGATGPHYLEAFFADVSTTNGGFPIEFHGGNRAPHANLVENGRGPVTPKIQPRLSWPLDSTAMAVKGVPAKNVVRDAVQIALARASR